MLLFRIDLSVQVDDGKRVFFPKIIRRALQDGRYEEAARMNEALSPLFKNLFIEPNPIPGKAAMSLLGLMENSLRLPLVSALPETEKIMAQTLKDLNLL